MCVCVFTKVCGNHNLRGKLTGRCPNPALLSGLGCSPCPRLVGHMHSDETELVHRTGAASLQAVRVSLHVEVGTFSPGQAFCS